MRYKFHFNYYLEENHLKKKFKGNILNKNFQKHSARYQTHHILPSDIVFMCFVYFNEKSVFYMRYQFDLNCYLDENLRVRRVKISASTLFNLVFFYFQRAAINQHKLQPYNVYSLVIPADGNKNSICVFIFAITI
jgi:hypothetical protein